MELSVTALVMPGTLLVHSWRQQGWGTIMLRRGAEGNEGIWLQRAGDSVKGCRGAVQGDRRCWGGGRRSAALVSASEPVSDTK